MKFTELAEKRYSCRKISDKKVAKEKIDRIIETAMVAPTAVNKQPVRIFRIESESAKENIAKVTNFTFGAENFIVVGYKEDEAWVREYDKHNFAEVDAAIVATHIMLEIENQGLSTTWVGHFDAPLLKELQPEMEGCGLISIFPIGYAAETAKPAHLHYKKRPEEELVITL